MLRRRVVEVYDPPSTELPEVFRTTGRYRHGFLLGQPKMECLVDFCEPGASPSSVPYHRILRPRPAFEITSMTYVGQKLQALVRLAGDHPLTWVAATVLGKFDKLLLVDVWVDGKVKALSAILLSKSASAGKALEEEALTVGARRFTWPSHILSNAKRLLMKANVPRKVVVSGNKRKRAGSVFVSHWSLNPTREIIVYKHSPQNYFANIPNEILVNIGQRLDVIDRKKLTRVNSAWRTALTAPSVEKTLVINMARFKKVENSDVELALYLYLMPPVENVVFDMTHANQEIDSHWDFYSGFSRIGNTSKYMRNFNLKTFAILCASSYQIEYSKNFKNFVGKLRIIHSWVGWQDSYFSRSKVYVTDDTVVLTDGHIDDDAQSFGFLDPVSLNFLDRSCIEMPLTKDEIVSMGNLAKEGNDDFTDWWEGFLVGPYCKDADGDPSKLRPFIVKLLRQLFSDHLKALKQG